MTSFTPQFLIQNLIESNPGVVQPGGFARYDPATGAILEVGRMPTAFITEHQDEGRPYVAAPDVPVDGHLEFLASNFVDLATKEIRPKAEFTGILAGTTITALPIPCRILVQTPFQLERDAWWAPQVHEWSDPDIELSFDTPDTYLVTVESVGQKTGQFRITANG